MPAVLRLTESSAVCLKTAEENARLDLETNLYAFMINIHSVVDNRAVAVTDANNLVGGCSPRSMHAEIGFFRPWFAKRLPIELTEYVPPRLLDNDDRRKYEASSNRLATVVIENDFPADRPEE